MWLSIESWSAVNSCENWRSAEKWQTLRGGYGYAELVRVVVGYAEQALVLDDH